MSRIKKSSVPTPQQVFLMRLNKGGWVVKGGAALKREFGFEIDPEFHARVDLLDGLPCVQSAHRQGDNIVVVCDDCMFTVPFKVVQCEASSMALGEEFTVSQRVSEKSGGGMRDRVQTRNSLTFEHAQRAAMARKRA